MAPLPASGAAQVHRRGGRANQEEWSVVVDGEAAPQPARDHEAQTNTVQRQSE